MRKVLALLLSLVMTLTLLVPATWAEEKPAAGYQLPASLKGKTVILHTNDVHGAIDKYAKVAALKNECYDRGASAVVLLDAGDFSQGSTYVSLSKGATAVELMNAVGYDAVTLGNHEFDYGFPQLKANLSNAAADFLVTCVNLVDDKGDPIFAPGATAPVTDADGNPLFNLTVMGLATPETQTKANPALMKGLTFLSGQKLYDAANAVIKVAREEGNADIVIALTHLGVDASSEPNRSIDFVKNVPGVDIVIDGHSHTVMTANKDNGMIQSTGTGLAYVGAFVIDNATKSVESNGLIDLSTYTKEDASVKAIADRIIGEVDAEYGKVFAKTEVELNGAKEQPQLGRSGADTGLHHHGTGRRNGGVLHQPQVHSGLLLPVPDRVHSGGRGHADPAGGAQRAGRPRYGAVYAEPLAGEADPLSLCRCGVLQHPPAGSEPHPWLRAR